jgi:hypothetical protein
MVTATICQRRRIGPSMQYTVNEGAVSCAVIVSDVQGIHVSRLSVLFQLVPAKREISIGGQFSCRLRYVSWVALGVILR